nr:hypothetical protein [Tanacetum cinerariifolium]
MNVYTSELTSLELKAAVADYLIPMDLHPRLPPSGMMMDRLLSRAIGFLSRIKPVGKRKCFKEVTTRLKDLHDDFPYNFNQDDVERLSEFLVPLRPPPRHLLYVCGLTTACRHPGLSCSIKDQDINVISMDTFLKLPTWTETIVSKGDPIPEDQRPKPRVTPPLPEGSNIPNLTAFQRSVEMPNTKIAAAREKKEKQSLARAEAKCPGAGQAGSQGRNGRFRNKMSQISPDQSRLCLLAPFVKLILKPLRSLLPSFLSKLPGGTACRKGAQSHQSSYQGHELVDNRYVPNWELQNDLRVCTYRAYQELVNHVTTPAEDEFLGTLSNAKVFSRAYQTLRQSIVAQGELLKRHEQLNHDYVDLRNRHDTDLAELERLRSGLHKANQDKDEITKKFTLLDNAHSECTSREKELLDMRDLEPKTQQLMAAEEKVKMLEHKRLALSAQLSQSVADRKKLVKEFIPTEERHRALFTTPYPYVQKIADLCDLPLSELWPVHPDAPSPEGVTLGAAAENTIQQPPSTSPKTTSDIPFRTTT